MWFLSCDGDHLNGKAVWLRPGSKHLFGRTHPGSGPDQFHAITHKSVSRRHFELHVDKVEPGASAKIHKRSKITIKDLGSKAGTYIDNEKIKGDSLERSFDKGDHVLRLGNYDTSFRIKWQPMVFSFTGLSRAARQSSDPLAEYRRKVEELDVKCVAEFVANQTSHVITKKRNTTMALEALVNGRSIVTDQYLDAIQQAAEKPPVDGDVVILSSLERDWELNWPKELDYLPGPSSEPNPRPDNDEIFLPKKARSEMFVKYLFIFMAEDQYQLFLPVITGGGGKALLREVGPADQDPDFDEFLDYVKSCTGKKGDAAFRLSQHPVEKGGVVIVRPSDPIRVGGVEFIRRLDLALDQRSVQQNEFLEAILTTDPTLLRRRLEIDLDNASEADDMEVEKRNSAAPSENANRPATPPPPSAPARKRRNFVRQKITTFDDFDPSQIRPRNSRSPSRISLSPPASQSQRLAKDSTTSQTGTQSRKRAADTPLRAVETTGEVLDSLFTGAAAAKKRRLDTPTNGAKRTLPEEEDNDPIGRALKNKKRKSNDEEEDIKARLVAQRQEEDRLRAAEEEEALKARMEGVDFQAVRDGIVVEDMAVRVERKGTANGEWRDEWNGRANWKRFKKRKAGASTVDDGPLTRRVIVGLEMFEEGGGVSMNWATKNGRQSLGTSQKRYTDSESGGMRRKRRGVLADDAEVERETPEDEELRQRVERSRIDDEREEEERENDVLDMGNVRDPGMRRRQEEAKRREKDKRREKLSQLTSHTISQEERPSLLSGLRQMDKNRGAGEDKGRKRPREQIEEDDDDDEGGSKFRRRRRG